MNNSALSLALVALIVLAASAPTQAGGRGGAGFSGGRGGPGSAGARGGPAFAGGRGGAHHSPAHSGPSRHHHFHGRGPILVGVGAAFLLAPLPWWYYSPVYVAPVYPAPAYWYYCPSYGRYYPTVPTCPEPWLPVPVRY